MTNRLCIYHGGCFDGFGAAYAVWLAFRGDCEFHPGVYGEDPPDCTGKEVIMVDFSCKRPVLEKIVEQCSSLEILDHHASAERELSGEWPHHVSVKFDMNRSGAMMAWEYFCVGVPRPTLIDHIQDRDLWAFKLEGTKEIIAALGSYPMEFEVWEGLMGHEMNLREEGVAIERNTTKQIEDYLRHKTFEMELDGFEVPVANVPFMWASEAGHILGKGKPFSVTYYDSGDRRTYSLRSDEDGEDVSLIAEKHGGGGHKHAAGFRVAMLPLEATPCPPTIKEHDV